MNVKRILTAIIGFPIVFLVLAFGNKYIIDAILAIIAIISMNEYIKCASENKTANVIPWISYLCVASIAFLHIVSVNAINFVATLGMPILLLILFFHVIVTDMKITFKDVVYTLIRNIIYIMFYYVYSINLWNRRTYIRENTYMVYNDSCMGN